MEGKTYHIRDDKLYIPPKYVMYFPNYLGNIEIKADFIDDEYHEPNKYYGCIIYNTRYLRSRNKYYLHRSFDTKEQAIGFVESFLEEYYYEILY